MLLISELFIYPIKSLSGIAVQNALMTDRGFQHDRRWLLVDEKNIFLTQRDIPKMALLQVILLDNGLLVFQKQQPAETVFIPFGYNSSEPVSVIIWEDSCLAYPVNAAIDAWFSTVLNIPCRLVYMPDDSHREVDAQYATNHELTSFSDGYPTLIIGQASLDDLNARLAVPVPMNRFRPNIVFTGGAPYAEDDMLSFNINTIRFAGVKPCARCMVTTIDQATAITGKDPLRTLSAYRMQGNKVLFGQNLLHEGSGWIRIGDKIIPH